MQWNAPAGRILLALCLIFGGETAWGGTETLCGDCTFRVEDDGLLTRLGADCGPLCVELRLDSRGLTSFDEGVFDNLPHLMFLFLHANKLSSIMAGTFAPLAGSLIELTLYQNMLTTVPPLASMSALETLYLHQNVITELPQDSLAGLPALISLKLHHNLLTSLPPLNFLTSLRDLTLQGNAIPCFPELPPELQSFEGDPGVKDCEPRLSAASSHVDHHAGDGGEVGQELGVEWSAGNSMTGMEGSCTNDGRCMARDGETERAVPVGVEQEAHPQIPRGEEVVGAGACPAGRVCTEMHSDSQEEQPVLTISFS